MKQIIILTATLFLLSTHLCSAQERKLKRADKSYNEYAYIDAIKIYKDVAESGFKSKELFKRLGDSYYFNSNYAEAKKWYEELFVLTENVKPKYFMRYSQSLKAIGNTELSAIWFDKYALMVDLSTTEFENAKDYLQIINKNSDRYKIHPLSINTNGIDFGAGLKNKDTYNYKRVVFASSNNQKKSSNRNVNAWTGMSFLDLYEASIDVNGVLSNVSKLEGDVNTKDHESSAVFTKDGKTMYFTRNNTSPRNKRSKKETNYLKIYRASLINGEWTNIEDLSINGDNYSTAHPALNSSENKLYFVSDMPTTIGQSDIFAVTINKNGSLGKPYNLGQKVNTKGRESFPYVSKDDELYFSSDGHFGLGGFDVYYIQLKGSGYTGGLLNLGKPINSPFDDYAFVIDNHRGFVSSNRIGGIGFDDIYGFVELKDIKDLTIRKLYGKVIDADTKLPLIDATITIVDPLNNILKTVTTNSEGIYVLEVERSKSYIIKVNKQGYDGDDMYSEKYSDDKENDFELSTNFDKIKKGDDLSEILKIIIYFDYNKATIRTDAQVELEKIISVLKQNPTLSITIKSHTDSRGDDNFNLNLSNKRAASTMQYIIDKGGIEPNRLNAIGYGETQLLNACVNGVECSDILHQANRRSEFIILK